MATDWDLGPTKKGSTRARMFCMLKRRCHSCLFFSAVGASFRAGGALAGPFAYIFINIGCGAAAMGPMRGGGAAAKGPRRRGAAAKGPHVKNLKGWFKRFH